MAGQEHIDLTADGAELLSRLADGALRDGLSLLDQCAAAGGTVDSRAVLEVLGLAGNLQTAQLMRHILDRNAQAALLCMDMMDFDRKEMVMQRIAANAQQYAQSVPLPPRRVPASGDSWSRPPRSNTVL